jgi:hypothetical protein
VVQFSLHMPGVIQYILQPVSVLNTVSRKLTKGVLITFHEFLLSEQREGRFCSGRIYLRINTHPVQKGTGYEVQANCSFSFSSRDSWLV